MKKIASLVAVLAVAFMTYGLTAVPTKANFPDGMDAWADGVFAFSQGTRADGSAVPAEFSDPWQALGVAEGLDPVAVVPATSMVHLGYKGQVTLKFDSTIVNKPGKDFRVIALRNPNKRAAKPSATVAVSENCWKFRIVGTISQDASFDLGLYRYAKCVQITDRSNRRAFAADSMGFALDGVMVLNSTNDQPWIGQVNDSRFWRIDDNAENDLWLDHSLKSGRGEASGFCNSLWDQAITLHNNYVMNPSSDGTAFQSTYFSTVGKSSFDGQSIEQLHTYFTTFTCTNVTHRQPSMRNLLVQLTALNKGKSLWVASTPVTP